MKVFFVIASLVSLAAAASVRDNDITVTKFELTDKDGAVLEKFDCTDSALQFNVEYTMPEGRTEEWFEIWKDGQLVVQQNILDVNPEKVTLNPPFNKDSSLLVWTSEENKARFDMLGNVHLNGSYLPGQYTVRVRAVPLPGDNNMEGIYGEKNLGLTDRSADKCLKHSASEVTVDLKDISGDKPVDATGFICKKDKTSSYTMDMAWKPVDDIESTECQVWKDDTLIAASDSEDQFPGDLLNNENAKFVRTDNTATLTLTDVGGKEFTGDYKVKIINKQGAMPETSSKDLATCGAAFAPISLALMLVAFVLNKFLA